MAAPVTTVSSLRLPKRLEQDERYPLIVRRLGAEMRPLWSAGVLEVPTVELTPPLATALKSALSAKRIVRGLEDAERSLAAEAKGLRLIDDRTGAERGSRVSRLLLLADDGAESFCRQVEMVLQRHSPRVLAVRLCADGDVLGRLLYGPDKLAKLVMVDHKDAVAQVLLALAGEPIAD